MNRTRTYAAEAVVLRRDDFGEADRLVTLLTPTLGKLRVVAKGARKVTSRKAGHIELFTRTRLLLARGRTFDLITQAELIEPHRALREVVQRGALAHYVCELAEQFAPEGSDAAPLYALLVEGLGWLCEANDPALAVRQFEMRLLTIEGYRPELFRCARTGAALAADQADRPDQDETAAPIAFSPSEGGTLAAAAAQAARDVFHLTRSDLLLLRALQTQPFSVVQALHVPVETHNRVERAMQAYIAAILERQPKTATFIRQLAREIG